LTGTQLADAQAPGGNRQMINAIIASCSAGRSICSICLYLLMSRRDCALFFPFHPCDPLACRGIRIVRRDLLMVRSAPRIAYAASWSKGRRYIAIVGSRGRTAAFGALPTIAQAACRADQFLILRLVQGVFGGALLHPRIPSELNRSREVARRDVRVLVGGGGAGIGALLASFAFLITSSVFPGEAFAQWGWRFMFFSAF